MRNERIERVRAGYERWSRGEDAAAGDPPPEDFELRPPQDLLDSDVYRGPAALREFAAEIADGFESLRINPLGFEEADETMLVHVHLTARGRSTGIGVERDEFHLWIFRAGRPRAILCFPSREEAVAASGGAFPG